MTQDEAFKTWWYNEGSQAPYTHHDCEEHTMRMCEIAWNKAQALAQPEQEPVAMVESVATVVSESGNKEITMSWWHEPALPVGTKLYTLPPQRKPLTDEVISALWSWSQSSQAEATANTQQHAFARAIEAAHDIKE